ncbi:MAG: hypothetical protein A2X66_06165 [Ignavibacteria bacterium GWA2_54_16]|nr:MAG: hypothetical protein A2X66_06165 [Ignavibacteria bacterium GWA2_54_16]
MDIEKTILVVDDDREVRSVVSVVLRRHGFKTLEAENGSDALTLAAARTPDLIISDVMMDNMNGFMLREMLQKDPATAGIPMILMTGAAGNAGAWETDKNVTYLRKPIGMETLVNEVLKKLFPNRADRKSASKR